MAISQHLGHHEAGNTAHWFPFATALLQQMEAPTPASRTIGTAAINDGSSLVLIETTADKRQAARFRIAFVEGLPITSLQEALVTSELNPARPSLVASLRQIRTAAIQQISYFGMVSLRRERLR